MKLEIFKFSRWGGSGAARSPPSSTDASGITTTMTGGDRHCGRNGYVKDRVEDKFWKIYTFVSFKITGRAFPV